MAIDFLLLQRYPDAGMPRFRHYDWRGPAFTFGYSQKIALVREQLPAGETFDICRRPTGGGIVDHRDDWTYALVIPRGHPLEESRATVSYRAVHEAVAASLRSLGVAVELKAAAEAEDEAGATGVCFQRAEIHDVVHAGTGLKIAGAAQKRNKHGILFQGSISRAAVAQSGLDWDEYAERFTTALAAALEQEKTSAGWPELNEDEVSGLSERYASTEWMEYR